MNYVRDRYVKFLKKVHYIPKYFNPYHAKEITTIAPAQTTYCGSTTSSSTILIVEEVKDFDNKL